MPFRRGSLMQQAATRSRKTVVPRLQIGDDARMTRPLTVSQYHHPGRPDKRLIPIEQLPPPSVAIRCHCLECVGWNNADVRRCDGNLPTGKCPLWRHRLGNKRGSGSPCRAIHRECVICIGGSRFVGGCKSTRCALYPYRFGGNPRTNQRARSSFDAGKPPQTDFPKQGATFCLPVEP